MLADPVSTWFEAQGIPPVVGGVLMGAAFAYLLLRARRERRPSFEVPRVPEQRPVLAAQGDVRERALELVRAKRKIEAIKLVREEQGLGLKEAKDVVDAWEKAAKR